MGLSPKREPVRKVMLVRGSLLYAFLEIFSATFSLANMYKRATDGPDLPPPRKLLFDVVNSNNNNDNDDDAMVQLFAKRKRAAGGTATPKSKFASDPVVEALLKQDPSTWNSKQKRMVKRYQSRKNEDEGTAPATEGVEKDGEGTQQANSDVNDEVTPDTNEARGTKVEEDEAASDPFGSIFEDGSNDSDSSSDESSSSNEHVVEEGNNLKDDNTKKSKAEVQEDTSVPPQNQASALEEKGEEKEIQQLLQQLNSKLKRTLTRKLDRGGPSVFQEVKTEAQNALGIDTSAPTAESKKRLREDTPSSGKKKKRGKKSVDWSSLPLEERVRREEQRRLQKEAAERREKGETTPGHKHPLNSERRRANRRKPKWNKTAGSQAVFNDHHSSGYLHRKTGVSSGGN